MTMVQLALPYPSCFAFTYNMPSCLCVVNVDGAHLQVREERILVEEHGAPCEAGDMEMHCDELVLQVLGRAMSSHFP